MPESTITPQMFCHGETVPRRISGSETEIDVQIPGETIKATLDETLLDNIYEVFPETFAYNVFRWLPNGGKLYLDSQRLEYSSFEGDSPAINAAGRLAGIRIIQELAAATPGVAAYYHAGTTIGESFRSLGHQQNYMTPTISASPELRNVWDTYQATRIWAWAGMVGIHGFELSQKAQGIGHGSNALRTCDGDKPMSSIHIGDGEIFAPEIKIKSSWTRVEGLVGDALFSRWATFMSDAVGSLILRFFERKDVLGPKYPLQKLQLINPVATLHAASRDLAFKRLHTTKADKDKFVTAINIQERIADYGDALRQRIQIPAAEHAAVDELYNICDRLRRTDIPNGDVRSIMGYVDFAPRLAYLLKSFDLQDITSKNNDAVMQSLLWSRIQPEGPGLRYWNNVYNRGKAPDPVDSELIAKHFTEPCSTTRAAVRAAVLRDPKLREHVNYISWPQIQVNNELVFVDPYQTDPAFLYEYLDRKDN